MTDQNTLDKMFPSMTPQAQAVKAEAEKGPMSTVTFVKGGTDAVDEAIEANRAQGFNPDGSRINGAKASQPKAQAQSQPQAEAITVEAAQATITDVAAELGVVAESIPDELSAFVASKGYQAQDVQALMELHTQAVQKAVETNIANWEQQVYNEFSEQEIQGAISLVNRFGDDEFKALLSQSGIGSHPAAIRFMSNVARGGRGRR